MNKKYKQSKKSLKNSPILFEDDEIGTSSSDEVKVIKLAATPRSKSYVDHSTPIKNRCNIDCGDSPDMNYNESPLEPLTQHPPNEVGWDYQRIIKKDEGAKSPISMEISRTPKRSVLLPKKRNSNSPLLYKPLKKKLIQEEQQEHMAGFMAELKAIEMKAKQIGEKNTEVVSNAKDETESRLIVELDSQPTDCSDIKLQVSAIQNESSIEDTMDIKKSYNALLDDSIEDIMVLCSQEVEAKEYGNTKMQYNNSSQEKSMSPDASLEKTCITLFKENQRSLNNNERLIGDKNSPTNKKESGSLEIPDDSFDEFFVGIDDKDIGKSNQVPIDNSCKSVGQNSKTNGNNKSVGASTLNSQKNSSQNKFFQSKNSTYIALPKGSSATNNYTNNFQTSNASVQNKVINTKASFGYLNKNYVRNNNSSGYESQTQNSDSNSSISTKSSNTRLFKAKSYSDSNFLHQNNSNNNIGNNYKSNSNFNLNSAQQEKEQIKSSVSQNVKSNYYDSNYTLQGKSWRRIQSSSSIDKSIIDQQSNVHRISNCDRSQLLSTAADIERKRQEAIMKREAKLKIKFDHMSLKRSIQRPIKR
ncbi:PREDICTED: GATA zinc finger domain-containing protein 8-like [Ceratosolen solmsi marchali]|uniref:GATA zinc finger domain-containing protein 8-like n=1 Tax=Ceratosolen solmsi marchali TaxID=326594 RepID=A0AAJ6YIP9_9HYME|nr:PREDICTED: GATA zinc finger domain-containing protein 8-like [Ceratosolen solmsi marchali]